MIWEDYLVIAILVISMVMTVMTSKLTVAAALTGGVIGMLLYVATGLAGLTLMATFFVLGTVATSYKHNVKQQQNLAEVNKGRRKASQVIANAGVAAILSALALLCTGYEKLFELMIAASFASAAADTLSSELGNVFGRKFYNILTLRNDLKGLDGVISIEGTLCGVGGSVLIATIYSLWNGWGVEFLLIVVAGTIGNIADSILGASVERKGYLKNDAVNFLNTLIAALAAWVLWKL